MAFTAPCRKTRPGPSNETHTVIRQGLEEGGLVIAGPYKVLDSVEHEELVRDMDEDRFEHNEGFARVRRTLRGLVQMLCENCADR